MHFLLRFPNRVIYQAPSRSYDHGSAHQVNLALVQHANEPGASAIGQAGAKLLILGEDPLVCEVHGARQGDDDLRDEPREGHPPVNRPGNDCFWKRQGSNGQRGPVQVAPALLL